jgi:signal transduction histidine kinase
MPKPYLSPLNTVSRLLPDLWQKVTQTVGQSAEITQEQWADRWVGQNLLRSALAVVALALAGLLVATLVLDRLRVHDEASESIHNVSLAVREHLLHVFSETNRVLQTTKDPAIAALSTDPKNLQILRDSFASSRLPPYLLALAVSAPDGSVLETVGLLGQGGQQVLRTHLADKRPVPNKEILSPLLQLPISSSTEISQGGVIFISQPVFAADGQLLGWVSAAVKPSFFDTFFRAMELGVGGLVEVVRLDGSILIRTPYHLTSGPTGSTVGDDVVSHFNRASQGLFEGVDPVDGVKRIYAYGTMENVPMAVVVGIANQDVYAGWTRRAWMLGLFGTITMAIIAILSRQLGRYIEAVQASRLRYRSAEEHLSQAQALAHLGSWQWVLADNRMWWSAEMKRLCGLSVHDASRQPSYDLFLALVHPADRTRVAIAIGQALDDGESFELDHRLLLADGTVRHVHQEGQCVLGEGGEVSRLDCVLQDITQAAELQAQLADAAKLSTLGEMASGMAHELSQPLNIIHMTAEGALIELDSVRPAAADPSPEALAPTLQSLHDAVNRIANQAGRMGQVLDHIRIFSRRDSGPAELFDAAVVMRRAQDSLRSSFLDSAIDLQSSVPDALTAPVMGHPVQLEQVLINLLINAKEAVLASRNGSPTSARSPRGWIRLAAQRLGSDLQIQIQDSGSGIPDDQLARLFEPFYTTKDAGGGPGLGLSVAYGIITTMGGKLTAQNSAHGGAVFELRIPVQSRALPDHPPLAAPQGPISPTDTSLGAVLKASTDRIDDTPAWPQSGTSTRPRPAQESKKAAPATPRAPHLLFIERAPGALMAMRMHLARKGYLTSTAETLPEAEAVARSHSLSLVLTDHLVATNAEGPICPSILSAIRTVDPSLPILGLVAHHPLPVASGGGLTQSTRPLNGGTNEAPVHVIRQAVGLSDLYDIVQSIQRTG